MKLSKRDTRLLLILGGLVVFLGCYMLGYQKLVQKTESVEKEISLLRPEVELLENHYLNLENYQTGIAEGRNKVQEGMAAYPANVKEEDFLSYLLVMEKAEKITLQNVLFETPTVLNQFDATVYQEEKDTVVPATVYRHGAAFTALMNYKQAKNVLDYIYASEFPTIIDEVTFTYNPETAGLTASFTLTKYSLDWPLGVYEPEPIPETGYGVDNLFGTN